MVPKAQPRSKFGVWLLKHRFIIIISMFVLLIPIAFVIALYVGDYLRYQNVTFEEGEVVSNFRTMDYTNEDTDDAHEVLVMETQHVIIYAKLMNIIVPEYIDELDVGRYEFQFRYETKGSVTLQSINIRALLQTDWVDARSEQVINLQPPRDAWSTTRNIDFKYQLPVYPLWFVKVERPLLYVHLSYTYQSGFNTETVSTYFKGNLTYITPVNELD